MVQKEFCIEENWAGNQPAISGLVFVVGYREDKQFA